MKKAAKNEMKMNMAMPKKGGKKSNLVANTQDSYVMSKPKMKKK